MFSDSLAHHQSNQDTLYSYTIVAVNQTTQCISNQISGSFNVLRGHELKRLSPPSTETQIICEGDPLNSTIRYEFGGGADNVQVSGLPNGIGWEIITGTNIVEISGSYRKCR